MLLAAGLIYCIYIDIYIYVETLHYCSEQVAPSIIIIPTAISYLFKPIPLPQ